MQKHQVEAVVAEMRRELKQKREMTERNLRARLVPLCSKRLGELLGKELASSFIVVDLERFEHVPMLHLDKKKRDAVQKKIERITIPVFRRLSEHTQQIEDAIRDASLRLTLTPAEHALAQTKVERAFITRRINSMNFLSLL